MKSTNKKLTFPGELMELGSFELTQSVMRVSDPCYERNVWCCGTVDDCKIGTWEAGVFVRDEDDWGERMAVLAARFADGGPRFEEISRATDKGLKDWTMCRFEVGVDSGQAGIFDETHYMDNSIFETKAQHDIDEEWYNHCCDITLSSMGAGVLPFGVVSRSGYGDGGYYAMKHSAPDGQVDGIYVVFIDGGEDGYGT